MPLRHSSKSIIKQFIATRQFRTATRQFRTGTIFDGKIDHQSCRIITERYLPLFNGFTDKIVSRYLVKNIKHQDLEAPI